ncbi:MAG: NlpC/P60 family protein [candidate division Zixibacteria bacterium]|nr:NlpC/P60 family protein [candidate division Zixibacteria bacterium]
MNRAFVTTNLLDLWAEPKYNSERVSQLFFGEELELYDSKDGYVFVKQNDGYSGWADERFLKASEQTQKAVRADSENVVQTPFAKTFGTSKGDVISPFSLFYGTKLHGKNVASQRNKFSLPDDSAIYLSRSSTRPVKQKNDKSLAVQIVRDARKFLGIPYLWGGITTLGFDCSGFVQTIYGSVGVRLPRDTKDQIGSGKEVSRDEAKKGDLLFFKRHVGIVIDRESIIHASIGGGGVRINSLKSGMPEYREDLDRNFQQARRVL